MNIRPLLQDITDQLKEAQIKLGFGPSTVKLYYTPAALAVLTGCENESPARQAASLAALPEMTQSPLGALQLAPHEDRVEVTIPQAGVRYVHENVEASPFLCGLIGLFAGHYHTTMAQVTALFDAQQAPYERRDMPEGAEFDCMLCFPGGVPDGYCYFFKEEMGHLSYHRFRPEDARHLLEEN